MNFKTSWTEVILDKMRAVLHRENVEGTIPSLCSENEQKGIKKSSGGKLVAPIHILSFSFQKKISQFPGRRGGSSAGKPSSGTCHNCCCSGAHSGRGKLPGMEQWANLCASSLAFELAALLSHCAGEVEALGLKQ